MTIDREFCELLEALYGEDRVALRDKCAELSYTYEELIRNLRTQGHVATRSLFEETMIARGERNDQAAQPQDATTDDKLAWLPQDATLFNLYMASGGLRMHWKALAAIFNDAASTMGKRTVRTLLHMTDLEILGLDSFSPLSLVKLDTYLLHQLGVSRDGV